MPSPATRKPSTAECGAVYFTQPRKVEHMEVAPLGDRGISAETSVIKEKEAESPSPWHSGGSVTDFFGNVRHPSGNEDAA